MPEKGTLKGRLIGKTGRTAEKRLAGRIGGRLTVGSGNLSGDKGDLRLEEFLVETKATEGASYSIKHDLLAKIAREALEKGLEPAFHVQFVTPDGRPKKMGSWFMVPESVWKTIEAKYAERD